ncbi:MAG: gliding motility protein GldN [Duncaniella sp.]|nr:gliding motility protein GldN [Bacteroides sp.]MBD5354993.1 gliding motility protein GldN [Bacteroides sp.]MDE6062507.1 gliding motility protein GldN [Duncaniella sp.]MDE6429625.1 gliding motility protein GldN [Duncaniella sp.]MDE6825032.1 gliding motility protein GldN [Duncaniella sp.]
MKKILLTAIAMIISAAAFAQESSSSSVVRRRNADDRNAQKNSTTGVTQRMQSHFEDTPVSDSEMQWMRVMYRQLDLMKDENAALYYPDEPVEGQENLFRIILGRMANNELTGYEYLDGREMFTDNYKVNMRDVLDRFHILYTDAKGSTERNPRFVIEEADVPASEVLSYYIIERWEFDKRQNRMRTRIEAVCPVLHRSGDFGGEAVKYPMFWVKYDDLRPYLTTQNIFTNDDNNLASCTYDDYFQLGLYKGDIYKTRNLKNRSLMQMYPDPDELAHAQDSIQKRLDSFEEKLWVPSLEELAARREAAEKAEMAAAGESVEEAADAPAAPKAAVRSARSKRGTQNASSPKAKPAKVKKAKAPKASSSSSAVRSVRNRRR